MSYVIVHEALTKSFVYELGTHSYVAIGSDKKCDLVLESIRPFHCVLILMVKDVTFYWVVKDGYLFGLADQGTFVNNKPIENITRLNHGDRISFWEQYPWLLFLEKNP
jgi:hypothetical protein